MASSLLGTGFFQPQARPGGVTVATERLAEEIAPFMQDYLERESALATLRSEGLRDEETGELVLDPVTGEPVDPGGYKAFTGQTIADFTPEQLAAQRGLAGIAGFDIITDPETGERSVTQTGTGLAGTRFADAEALIRGQQEEFTGDVAQRFMSPFQQAVIDIEKREAQQKFEQDILPKVQAAAIQSGSFGGSRGALLEAEALRGQQQLLGDIQSKGLQAAFTQGRQAFEAQKARERGQAQALMGLSPAETAQRTKELQGLERVGAAQQAQTQTALDEAYKQFLEEQAFPETVLDRMQAAAFGFPALKQEITQRPTTFGPSPFQTLATNVGAIGTGIGNLFGQLGGKRAGRNQGGVVSRRDGGLVPLVRRQQGSIGDDELGEDSVIQRRKQSLGGGRALTPLSPRGAGLTNVQRLQARRRQARAEEDVARQNILEQQQQILDARKARADKAYQAKIDREQARRDPFGIGLNTTALFRMLGQASNVKDYQGPQGAGIFEEGQKIAAERMATDEKLAAEDALRREALQTAREDAELQTAREEMLAKIAREKEDLATGITLEELDIKRQKVEAERRAALKDSKKYMTASEFNALRKEIGLQEGLSWDEANQTIVLPSGDSLDSKKGFELSVRLLDSLKGFTNKNSRDFQDSLLITLKSKADNLLANYNVTSIDTEGKEVTITKLTNKNLDDLANKSPAQQEKDLKKIVKSGGNPNIQMSDIPTIMKIIKIRSAK
jgi:hypothetical protein